VHSIRTTFVDPLQEYIIKRVSRSIGKEIKKKIALQIVEEDEHTSFPGALNINISLYIILYTTTMCTHVPGAHMVRTIYDAFSRRQRKIFIRNNKGEIWSETRPLSELPWG